MTLASTLRPLHLALVYITSVFVANPYDLTPYTPKGYEKDKISRCKPNIKPYVSRTLLSRKVVRS